jgi:hypothetical protein
MTDILENVALLTVLLLSGVAITVTTLIMLIKALDYLENGYD